MTQRLQDELSAWLGERVDAMEPLGGGSICAVYHLRAGDNEWCLKSRHDAPRGFFATERDGLAALGVSATVRVPAVHHCAGEWLLLEWLPPAQAHPGDAALLGRQLASLHDARAPSFGFPADNFCGLSPQANTIHDDGHDFFARCRLLAQGDRAHAAGLLPAGDRARLDRVVENLRQSIPDQPPSLIHGDLWQGNIHFSSGGPALIDPAAHHGWGEADLAMTHLFGAPDPALESAYREARPLAPGFDDRVPLYNLYHLLNHLNLFGAGWLSSVRAVLDRFA